jgi:hypothetical protein
MLTNRTPTSSPLTRRREPHLTTRRRNRIAHSAGNEDEAHALVEVRHDELGLVAVCTCGHWGYAGPDEQSARELHAQHVEDVTGTDYSSP